MIAIVILSTALAEPNWISLKGGACELNGEPLNRLGTDQFFYPGRFLPREKEFADDSIAHEIYQFGPDISDRMFFFLNLLSISIYIFFFSILLQQFL